MLQCGRCRLEVGGIREDDAPALEQALGSNAEGLDSGEDRFVGVLHIAAAPWLHGHTAADGLAAVDAGVIPLRQRSDRSRQRQERRRTDNPASCV